MLKYNVFRIRESDLSNLNGIFEISHNKIHDGNYAKVGEKVEITLSLPISLSVKNISVFISNAHDTALPLEIKGHYEKSDRIFDYFIFTIEKINRPGLFFYYFKLDSICELFGYRKDKNTVGFISYTPSEKLMYQLTVYDDAKDRNFESGIIYHIFVDRFRKAGKIAPKENAVIIDDWDSEITEFPEYPGAYLKNNTFFGGNIYGIIEKLDYIKSLGTSYIYLSPIFDSPSNHKYDTADYEKIDKMFGGEKAFDLLIEKATEKNIGIILDGVFNHTGADSKYFNKNGNYKTVGAYQSKNSAFYNWYRFKSFPDKYDCWWGIDILPRIFYENSNAEEYFLGKNGIISKWMSHGIKGFRLDVVDELSDSFVVKMRNLLFSYDNSALLYGEVWEDASNKIAYGKRKRYYLGNELSGVMNYPLRTAIISYILYKNVAELDYYINITMNNMPKSVRDKAMNLLGSHDTERILTVLGGKESKDKSNKELATLTMSCDEYLIAKRRLLAAYTVISTLPGIPTVYYGDEAGMEGYNDPFNRRTYPWGKEDKDIILHYKKIGAIRLNEKTLQDGDFLLLHLDQNLLIFERIKNQDRILTIYNNSKNYVKFFFSEYVTDLYSQNCFYEFVLSEESAAIFKCGKSTVIKFHI